MNESYFRGARLKYRLRRFRGGRRGSDIDTQHVAETDKAPVPPASTACANWSNTVVRINEPRSSFGNENEKLDLPRLSAVSIESPLTNSGRYFILKSFTLEDLDTSVREGTWTTQIQNEAALTLAFRSTEDVYLIFLANRSGEYYGYARMQSAPSETGIASSAAASSSLKPSKPLIDRTLIPATEHAPRGYLINNFARSTFLWEVEGSEAAADALENGSAEPKSQGVGEEKSGYGRSFKVQWKSTSRLPFYLSRGLRNSFNANREVKVARDGQELEPTVGRHLLTLFARSAVG